MAKVGKLERFEANKHNDIVVEAGKTIYDEIKGNWNDFFGNNHPIVVELACGKGEYTVSLAEKFPDKNFVGVDLKGDRIWVGSQYAVSNKLNNVAFLRTHISNICELFAENEVSEIWLTFPDPRPKDRDEKHRLSNKFFLNLYKNILKPNGWFKFKTDSTSLFDYTLEVLEEIQITDFSHTFDLYNSAFEDEHYGIKTKYEAIWTAKGEKIKYMKFKFQS